MFVYVVTGLARECATTGVLDSVLKANVKEAASRVLELIETRKAVPGSADLAELALLGGDLMLAQDRDEEGEELYRIAVKAAGTAPRGRVRVVSCRNTGFLSLYQQRYGTAATCFHRVAEDPVATVAQRVEGLAGLAMAQHGMGQTQAALHTLESAAELARDCTKLGLLVELMQIELLAQREVRSHAALRDHVFWQPAGAAAAGAGPSVSARASIDACLHAHGHHELVGQRMRHWHVLVGAGPGQTAGLPEMQGHLAWLRRTGLAGAERQGRLDVALMAVVARDADMARSVLEPLLSRAGGSPAQRWTFELSYCLAKVCELGGRTAESLSHYQHYALETVQCLRTEWPAEAAVMGQAHAASVNAVKDDVEMSLPAKYRRAYRYLLEHLDRGALSVREIAEHVGVTERALQSVFRARIGMTPAEVIRRCRVERIHDDLLKGQLNGRTVLEAGARWGIGNRSTLISSYRRHYFETPAETLQRRGEPPIAPPRRAMGAGLAVAEPAS